MIPTITSWSWVNRARATSEISGHALVNDSHCMIYRLLGLNPSKRPPRSLYSPRFEANFSWGGGRILTSARRLLGQGPAGGRVEFTPPFGSALIIEGICWAEGVL